MTLRCGRRIGEGVPPQTDHLTNGHQANGWGSMKAKTRKQRQAAQLGMPMGTARSKLQRKLIWDLLNKAGENECEHCGDWISRPEDLAITHVEPWLDNDPELFWDTRNVAFMHPPCAEHSAAERNAARRQKEKEKMSKLVNVGIVNERGEWLPGCYHDGKVYVAGKHGERYQIALRNQTGERVEVVLTVDGRDVISGEAGSKDSRGYVLQPFETCQIDGWRTSDDTVAAFRFGADKDKAYSTQLGTGAHLGVIGVAVFEERQSSWFLRSSTRGVAPAGMWGGSTTFTDSHYSAEVLNASAEVVNSADLSLHSTRSVREERAQAPNHKRSPQVRRRKQAPREEVKLGTKFGEEIQSSVHKTTFTRLTAEPSQVLTIEYDTFKNLKRRGIPIKRSKPRVESPSAFPADNDGYCKAPPRR